MRQLVLIAHNLRSSLNVGSLLRTADGLGIQEIWLTGYTPHPKLKLGEDIRPPYLAEKIERKISKTALGAEQNRNWFYDEDIEEVIRKLKQQGYTIAALEQTKTSIQLPEYTKIPKKLCLIVGREVEGLEQSVIDQCDLSLEIPMLGKKESYNVAVAAAIALYTLRFISPTPLTP